MADKITFTDSQFKMLRAEFNLNRAGGIFASGSMHRLRDGQCSLFVLMLRGLQSILRRSAQGIFHIEKERSKSSYGGSGDAWRAHVR